MEEIQITKFEWTISLRLVAFTKNKKTWAKHDPKVQHLFTNITQHQNKNTSKNELKLTRSYARTQHPHTKTHHSRYDSTYAAYVFHIL